MAHCMVSCEETYMNVYNSYNIGSITRYGQGVWKLSLIKPVRNRFKAAVLCGVSSLPGNGFQNGTRISHATFYRSNYEIFVTTVNSNGNTYLTGGQIVIAVYEE